MPVPFARSASQTRPTFSRDFAGLKTLDHGAGPAITFTRASNATFFNANGVLQTASNNQPRFDHDPATGASRGLLIEEARTNSIRNSQAGGSTNGVIGSGGVMPTNWTSSVPTGVSIEVVGAGTVSGFSYIDIKISGTNTSGSLGFANFGFESTTQVVASSGQSWTASAYIALTAGSFTNASPSLEVIGRDPSLVEASSVSITTASSTLARFSVARTLSVATTNRAWMRINTDIAAGSSINFTLRIAAPQLEQGAFPTSYIPTTTAAATRSADSAVVTPISSFYNQAEGTFVAEASYTGKVPAVFNRILSFGNTTGGDPDRWFWGFNDANTNHLIQHFTAGVFDFGVSFATSAGTVYRVASAMALNNARAAQNGSLLALDDTSVGAPSNKTHMVIGGSPTGVSGSALHFRKIAYYPRRLSNALLQQLTT